MKQNQPSKTAAITTAAILATASLAALWIVMPHARDFMLHEESRKQFADWISSFGSLAPAVVLAMQIAQILIAFLPGEPIEVVAGMVCGAWWGLVLCLVGILAGSCVVFLAVRRFGKPLVNIFFSDAQLEKYRFLQDEKSLERLTFLLFFIPGTPKDILNYIAGLTRVDMVRFLIISTVARIPSVLTSTIAGAALSRGEFGTTAVFFALAALLAAAGLRMHSRITGRLNAEHGSDEHDQMADTHQNGARKP